MNFYHPICFILVALMTTVVSFQAAASESVTGEILSVGFSPNQTAIGGQIVTVVVDVKTHGESALPSADPEHLAGKIILAECTPGTNDPKASEAIRQAAVMMKTYVEQNWRTIVDLRLIPKSSVTGIPTFTLRQMVLPTPNNYAQMIFQCEQ